MVTMDFRKRQTIAASPAEPGDLPYGLGNDSELNARIAGNASDGLLWVKIDKTQIEHVEPSLPSKGDVSADVLLRSLTGPTRAWAPHVEHGTYHAGVRACGAS
jgi:hypothetical protein